MGRASHSICGKQKSQCQALSPPRPCGPGYDPLRVSPLPVLGPLLFLLPPPALPYRPILPTSRNGANILHVSSHCRHRSHRWPRSRLSYVPAPADACALSALRGRHRFSPSPPASPSPFTHARRNGERFKTVPTPSPSTVIREGCRNLSEPFPHRSPYRRYSGRGRSSIRRSSCQPVDSQPLLATLTTFPVCLVSATPIQAGTRQPTIPCQSVGVNLRS